MYRLFVALDLQRDTDAQLDELVDAARGELGREFRPVKRGRRHITLCFLGDTDPDLVQPMAEDLARVAESRAAFEMIIEGAGAFPSPDSARVLWAGVKGGARRIADMAAEISHVFASSFGHPPERRPFHPHITVGRFRGRAMNVSSVVSQYSDRRWGVDPVAEIQLIRSDLARSGPTYTVLERLPLQGG